MSAIPNLHVTTRRTIAGNTKESSFYQLSKKITSTALHILKTTASYILPLLTKLTRSEPIAKGLLHGAFSGLVVYLVFRVLGLPTNNVVLTALARELYLQVTTDL